MDNSTIGTGSGEPQQGAGVELARMLTIIRRAILNWKPSAFLIAIGLMVGVAFAVTRKPSFRSETIVIYRQGVKLNQERTGTNLTLGTRLQEMLMARGRLEALADELNLYQDVKAKRGPIEMVEDFRKDITFKPRSTDTFSISFKGGDPETVKKVTERLAQSLIDENQRLRVQQARTQSEFLETEKKNADQSLKVKEREIATFLSEHPEFALDQAGTFGATMRVQRQIERENKLFSPSTQKDNSLQALRRQAARLNAALSGDGPAIPAVDAPPDPELESQRLAAESKLAAAKQNLTAKQATLQDAHPDVISAKSAVAEAQTAYRNAEDKANASRLSRSVGVNVDPEVAKAKLIEQKKKVEAEIAAAEGKENKDKDKDKPKDPTAAPAEPSEEALSVVSLETEWARRSRDVSEARDQMQELERNYFRAQIEASSSLGGYSDQVVVLDNAYTPTKPEPPGKSMIVAIAGGAAFVIAMILAIMRALLDSRIYQDTDLARVAPVLAVVPAGRRRWWRK